MKITFFEYCILFGAVSAAVLITYAGISLSIGFIRRLVSPAGHAGEFRATAHRQFMERRKLYRRTAERRIAERRIFNRGFYTKKGFFDGTTIPESAGDDAIVDRRRSERRMLDRRIRSRRAAEMLSA